MAKKTTDDDGEDSQSMTEDSLEFLDQVRKGKPRFFVMGIKGSSINALILKKKPVKEADLKEVRGSGFAPVFGVVTGTGTDLVFNVAKSDGFSDPPANGKTDKLKKFLSEQTGKTLKPSWAVVPELPAVEDDDQGTPPGSTGSVPEAITSDGSGSGNAFIDLLKKVAPQIQAAATARPDRLKDLTELVAKVKSFTASNDAAQAKQAFTELVNLIKELLAGRSPNSEESESETDEAFDEDEEMLANLFEGFEQETVEEEDAESNTEFLMSLEPAIGPELSEEELAKSVPETVKDKVASIGGRLRWQQAKDEVDENLCKLQAKLLDSDNENMKAIGEYGFNSVTGRLQVGLRVALTEFDMAAPDAQDPYREKALKIITQYREFLKTEPLVQLVDKNPLGVDVRAKEILGNALDDIESMLNESDAS